MERSKVQTRRQENLNKTFTPQFLFNLSFSVGKWCQQMENWMLPQTTPYLSMASGKMMKTMSRCSALTLWRRSRSSLPNTTRRPPPPTTRRRCLWWQRTGGSASSGTTDKLPKPSPPRSPLYVNRSLLLASPASLALLFMPISRYFNYRLILCVCLVYSEVLIWNHSVQ